MATGGEHQQGDLSGLARALLSRRIPRDRQWRVRVHRDPTKSVPIRGLLAAGLTAALVEEVPTRAALVAVARLLLEGRASVADVRWAVGACWADGPEAVRRPQAPPGQDLTDAELVERVLVAAIVLRRDGPGGYGTPSGTSGAAGPGLRQAAIDVARHADPADAGRWLDQWRADPDARGRDLDEWVSAWCGAGYGIDEVERLLSLPPHDPGRPTPDVLAVMGGLRSP